MIKEYHKFNLDRGLFFLVTFLFFVCAKGLSAQTANWVSTTNSWTYSSYGFDQIVNLKTNPPHRLVVDRDTMISGVAATILKQDDSPGYTVYNFDGFDTIIVRQEDEKFYQYIDSAFRMLYDFSLEVGDTMLGYVPRALQNRDKSKQYITFRIDSTETRVFGGRELKGQYLRWVDVPHDVDGMLAQGWHYELIGNVNSYLLPYGYFFCDGACPRFLRCFSAGGDGGDAFSYSAVNYPCDTTLLLSTREPDIGHLFKIGPNPIRAGAQLNIEVDESVSITEQLQVLLYDATGRQLSFTTQAFLSKLQVSIPVTSPAGVYTLVLRNERGRAVSRLVVLPAG